MHTCTESCRRELRRILQILGVLAGVCVLETLGWFYSHSMAVLGDIAHSAGDGLAIVLNLSVRLAICRGRDEPRTRRMGGLGSALLMLWVGLEVLIHGIERLGAPVEIIGLRMALAAGLASLATPSNYGFSTKDT